MKVRIEKIKFSCGNRKENGSKVSLDDIVSLLAKLPTLFSVPIKFFV